MASLSTGKYCPPPSNAPLTLLSKRGAASATLLSPPWATGIMNNARRRLAYAKDPEKHKARSTLWHKAHPVAKRAAWRRWRLKNLEKRREYNREWKLRNGERVTGYGIKALRPEESLFPVFVQMTEGLEDLYLVDRITPLDILIAKERWEQEQNTTGTGGGGIPKG